VHIVLHYICEDRVYIWMAGICGIMGWLFLHWWINAHLQFDTYFTSWAINCIARYIPLPNIKMTLTQVLSGSQSKSIQTWHWRLRFTHNGHNRNLHAIVEKAYEILKDSITTSLLRLNMCTLYRGMHVNKLWGIVHTSCAILPRCYSGAIIPVMVA